MKLVNKIESILFLSDKPVEIKQIIDFFNIEEEQVNKTLEELIELRKESGLNIKKIDDKYIQMVSNPNYGKTIHDFFNPEVKPKKLTQAALETLAIIAYNGPVIKSEIERIRGVNVEKVLTRLEEKKLIEICGKKKSIGNPNLYRVTENFLSYMQIDNIEDLPEYDEVKNVRIKNK